VHVIVFCSPLRVECRQRPCPCACRRCYGACFSGCSSCEKTAFSHGAFICLWWFLNLTLFSPSLGSCFSAAPCILVCAFPAKIQLCNRADNVRRNAFGFVIILTIHQRTETLHISIVPFSFVLSKHKGDPWDASPFFAELLHDHTILFPSINIYRQVRVLLF